MGKCYRANCENLPHCDLLYQTSCIFYLSQIQAATMEEIAATGYMNETPVQCTIRGKEKVKGLLYPEFGIVTVEGQKVNLR